LYIKHSAINTQLPTNLDKQEPKRKICPQNLTITKTKKGEIFCVLFGFCEPNIFVLLTRK